MGRRSVKRRQDIWAVFLVVLSVGVVGVHNVSSFAGPISYAVQFEESVEEDWGRRLTPLSETFDRKQEGAASLNQLKRRAEKDQNLFRTFLRSEGFYGSEVTYHIDRDTEPVTVSFSVNPGPQYLLNETKLNISQVPASILELLSQTARSALPSGSPALASRIQETDQKILTVLAENGYPLARIGERKVIVRHEERTVEVHYDIVSGPKCFFGPATVTGLQTVREDIVRARLPWKEGDVFDARLMTKAQNNLILLDLFSVVRITHASSADPRGRLPMEITVTERKPRTFKGGFFYTTDVGPELDVSWENRNLFEGKAKVGAETWLSTQKKVLDGLGLWRDFLRPDQSLQLEGRGAEEDWDAYWSRSLGSSISLVRDITPTIRAGVGAGFRLSSVEQISLRETYGLFFLPAFGRLDTTDNPLDPVGGFRCQIQTSPYWDVTDISLFFWKTSTTVSTYYDWAGDGRLVLASIFSGGTITGAAQNAVPPDVRFYVGGGGSVRGYPYQSLGPRDGKDPLGGRSFLAWNGEMRWRFRERYGLAAFLDGGTAYESTLPDLGRSFRWGTGLGFRYYSPLGPFRIDVAFPLNRRAGIDDVFQIYVSLGQAF